MATSQNGWPVYTSSTHLADLEYITGRVRPGDVHKVFSYLCQRFEAEVEPIIKGHSWGWAYRAVRGQTSGFSNHASGTAIDLNAPAHPLGVRGTFSSAQKEKIHDILEDLDGAVRWGGDYFTRADEMHFEINTGATQLKAVAANLHKEEDDMFEDKDRRNLEQVLQIVKASREREVALRKNLFKVLSQLDDKASTEQVKKVREDLREIAESLPE